MKSTSKNIKTCPKGHQYTKTSDCPTCPICEQERKSKMGLLSFLPAPARRALENNGIQTTLDVSKFTKKEILELHGIGPSSIPKLMEELKKDSLDFKIL